MSRWPSAGNGAGFHDQLILTGANSIYTAGGTVVPILRGIMGDANNSYTAQIGQVFTVVLAEGGVTGSYEGITQPTAGLAANSRFDVIYRDNTILLAVTPNSYAAFATNSSNGRSVSAMLDAHRGIAGVRDSSSTSALLDDLIGLNAASLGTTLEQLAGGVHAAAMDATTQANRGARQAVNEHLSVRDGTGNRIWGSISRDLLNIRSDGSGRGHLSTNYAMTVGVDMQASPHVTLGGAFTYATSDVRAGYLGSSDGSHYQGLAYGGWKSGGSYFNAMLGFGVDRYKVRRSVLLATGSQAIEAKPKGFSFGADIEAGHRFELGAIRFTPAMGLAYDNVTRSAFAENSSSSVALSFNGDSRNAWQVRGGARLSTQATIGSAVIEPFVQATAMRELDDSSTWLNPTLAGVVLSTHAASFGKSGVQGGAGINAVLSDAVGLGLGYRYTDTTNAHAHSVNGTLSIRW